MPITATLSAGLAVASTLVAGAAMSGAAFVGYFGFFWRAVPLYLIPY